MIKKIATLFFLCLTIGTSLAACGEAPDTDDAEVEVEGGEVEVDD